MEIFVDDGQYTGGVDASQTLSSLVDEVRARAAGQARMIVGIRCDGTDITDGVFQETLSQPIGQFERVELYTGEPREVVRDAMAHAESLLDEADADRLRVVELLSTGRTTEGIDQLGRCMQNWHHVHQGILNARALLSLGPDVLRVDDEGLDAALHTSRERLLQLRDALESRDFVLLTDTLQYEFAEVGQTWRRMIERIRERVAAV